MLVVKLTEPLSISRTIDKEEGQHAFLLSVSWMGLNRPGVGKAGREGTNVLWGRCQKYQIKYLVPSRTERNQAKLKIN